MISPNRFGIYGAVIMGPTMYVWVRTANVIWPRTDFRSSLSKAITEQFTVDPTLICTFLFVMSLLEQKTVAEANDEVSHHLYNCHLSLSFTIVHSHFHHSQNVKLNSSSKQILFQVRTKFIDTYKVGAIYWPTVQTVYLH